MMSLFGYIAAPPTIGGLLLAIGALPIIGAQADSVAPAATSTNARVESLSDFMMPSGGCRCVTQRRCVAVHTRHVFVWMHRRTPPKGGARHRRAGSGLEICVSYRAACSIAPIFW